MVHGMTATNAELVSGRRSEAALPNKGKGNMGSDDVLCTIPNYWER